MTDEQRSDHNRRLCREFELTHKLDHQNIVATLEMHYYQNIAWYVMELLSRRTLGRFLAEEQRPFRVLMDIYQQLAEALAYCHREGVVHRDLKPSNVLITLRDRQPFSQAPEDVGEPVLPGYEPAAPLVSELPGRAPSTGIHGFQWADLQPSRHRNEPPRGPHG